MTPATTSPVQISRLDGDEARRAIPDLVDILLDSVAGGASVSFMSALSMHEATQFWRGVADGVARGERRLFVAHESGRMLGTVQLVFAPQPNQPHRADVAKMLVHSQARRRGIGRGLLVALEEQARRDGRWLLVLDTVPGMAAESLYTMCGWQRAGIIPDYAMLPDGQLCDTAMFWKRLDGAATRSGGS
jgi:GNAT superfamily N-acetyltransferase